MNQNLTNTDQNTKNLSLPMTGRRVLITGSTSGIGWQTALAFARNGANLILSGRSVQKSKDLLLQLRNERPEIETVFIPANLNSRENAERLAQTAWNWKSGIDVLVNCAGVDIMNEDNKNKDFYEKLQLLWETDVLGTVVLSRTLGSRMQESNSSCVYPPSDVATVAADDCITAESSQTPAGSHSENVDRPSIINIGWDGTRRGLGGNSGELFALSKGAVESFTRSLAQTLAPYVRVNAIAPGWIQTKWGAQAKPAFQNRAKRQSLLERWGQASEVAQTAVFLASSAASYINGQIIDVNGGFNGN